MFLLSKDHMKTSGNSKRCKRISELILIGALIRAPKGS